MTKFKEIIFGVSEEYFDDEIGHVLFVTDKRTWEEENICSDQFENDFYNFMEDNGFYEIEDGIWEHEDNLDKEGFFSLAEKIGLVYNKDFENFMNDINKGDLL